MHNYLFCNRQLQLLITNKSYITCNPVNCKSQQARTVSGNFAYCQIPYKPTKPYTTTNEFMAPLFGYYFHTLWV